MTSVTSVSGNAAPLAPQLSIAPDRLLSTSLLDGSTPDSVAVRATAIETARAEGTSRGSAADVPSARITVRRGDTVESLAAQFGTTISKLAQLNPDLRNLDRLQAGQRLTIPVNRDVIQLQPGQTLSQLATRYGLNVDQLARANGIGNPNHIEAGARLSAIPARETGLATDAAVRAYISDVRSLEGQWSKLTPAQRLERLGEALNERLRAAGVPEVRLTAAAAGTASGTFDFTRNRITIDPSLLSSPRITSSAFRDLADTVYHEGRHAEQWFGMARVDIARGGDGSTLGMRPAVIAAAEAAPRLDLRSEAGRFTAAMYDNVYGAGAANRNSVLSNITAANYEQYRAMPEEADAWRVGGKVLNLWPR